MSDLPKLMLYRDLETSLAGNPQLLAMARLCERKLGESDQFTAKKSKELLDELVSLTRGVELVCRLHVEIQSWPHTCTLGAIGQTSSGRGVAVISTRCARCAVEKILIGGN